MKVVYLGVIFLLMISIHSSLAYNPPWEPFVEGELPASAPRSYAGVVAFCACLAGLVWLLIRIGRGKRTAFLVKAIGTLAASTALTVYGFAEDPLGIFRWAADSDFVFTMVEYAFYLSLPITFLTWFAIVMIALEALGKGLKYFFGKTGGLD